MNGNHYPGDYRFEIVIIMIDFTISPTIMGRLCFLILCISRLWLTIYWITITVFSQQRTWQLTTGEYTDDLLVNPW